MTSKVLKIPRKSHSQTGRALITESGSMRLALSLPDMECWTVGSSTCSEAPGWTSPSFVLPINLNGMQMHLCALIIQIFPATYGSWFF
ncbi:hypothetical protein PSHT_01823 [Puccinia striiformis]|uniref:Uncharacterized protein n=1 Tax=Puccinia striiformis TaxID=27350 RepID=A0A2S4WJF0_9BASI|nr:hypothetical protein PSHT_01823 [Puccinia striiformis]